MKKDTSDPAFPGNSEQYGPFCGMSLRDYFAAHCPLPLYDGRSWEEEALARYAYADAMIAERSK